MAQANEDEEPKLDEDLTTQLGKIQMRIYQLENRREEILEELNEY